MVLVPSIPTVLKKMVLVRPNARADTGHIEMTMTHAPTKSFNNSKIHSMPDLVQSTITEHKAREVILETLLASGTRAAP